MADAVVSSVIQRVGDALIQEAVFLHGVRSQVESMQAELRMMQCFLKDVDAKQQDGDERVRNWVAEIRDLSYRAEDVIDTFMLKRNACIFTKLVQQHKTRVEIEDIYKKIQDTTNRLERYGIKKIGEGEGTSSSNQIQQWRRPYPHFKENDVIGLDKDIEKMVAQLITEEERYHFVSIVGMGGSGKTTLAKEVYNHRAVKSAFDCCSWVYVSQECKPKDIFTSILNNVSSLDRGMLEKMKEDELVEKLDEILKEKRYLIVLDDIWSMDAWDRLKPAFPNRKMGSKILLTTRNEEVPLHADPWSPRHVPRRLTDDESWNLLCKKAFPEDAITSCGDFENLGREMIRKCENLPLAVVVLGGLLATKRTLDEWKMVHGNVTRHLYKRQQQHGVMDVLALSYHYLPSHLKPCFLYLGIYPEDFRIHASELIGLWVAEGFVPKSVLPPSQETILEDVAKEWLEELAHRCMIQLSVRGSTGSIKYFRVHDLMRDLCLSKAREEKFLEILIPSKSSESNGSSSIARKSRRSAIHYSADERYVHLEQLDPNVRSLLFVYSRYDSVSLKKEQAKPIFMNYHLIRVLDLSRVQIERGTLPREIGNLINLRYLSLFDSNIQEFPPSLGNLSNMQTLNIWTSVEVRKVRVPDVIWKMDKLRHLLLPWSLDNENLRLDTLNSLQTLKNVPCKFFMEKSVANLTNLKKLKIFTISTSEELDAFLESPVLEGIHSLSLFSNGGTDYQFSNLKRLSSCHNLSKLCVNGEISKHAQNDFLPPNLAKLKLDRTILEQDPMPALGNLFNLRILCLANDAYIGKEMICTSKAFPKLESLELMWLDELEELRVEEGAMPCLRQLNIWKCKKLRMIPEGLRFITTLQELEIIGMPKAFGNRIRVVEGKDGEDLYKVQHIPSIEIILETE